MDKLTVTIFVMSQLIDRLPLDSQSRVSPEESASLSEFFTTDDCSKPSTSKKWLVPAVAVVAFVALTLPQTRRAIEKSMGKSESAIILATSLVFAVVILLFWHLYGVNLK